MNKVTENSLQETEIHQEILTLICLRDLRAAFALSKGSWCVDEFWPITVDSGTQEGMYCTNPSGRYSQCSNYFDVI